MSRPILHLPGFSTIRAAHLASRTLASRTLASPAQALQPQVAPPIGDPLRPDAAPYALTRTGPPCPHTA